MSDLVGAAMSLVVGGPIVLTIVFTYLLLRAGRRDRDR